MHHWTNMHGCTFRSKVLSCNGITSTRPILCFVLILIWNIFISLISRYNKQTLISMYLLSVSWADQFYRYHTFQETWSAPKKYALHHPNITPGCNLTQSMGSFWWWSLDNYRLIIRLSFNRHPMIIAQTCVISWLNRRPIVGSWRSGWRLSGNPGSPANPGNLWKPCFRTPWDPTQILRPPVLDLTSASVVSPLL